MANRFFNQFRFSMEKNVVDLYLKVNIGASGAPTIARGKGIASITRTSAGLYVITLQDKYHALLNVQSAVKLASGLPASALFAISAEAVATAKTITVQYADGDTPAATDPDSGAVLYFTITLSNSSAL